MNSLAYFKKEIATVSILRCTTNAFSLSKPCSAILHLLLVLSLAIFSIMEVVNATPPPDFENQLVLGNISQPISMTFLPDGRMFILRKSGEMLIADPTETLQISSSIYMMISNIDSGGERGLIDITLDNDFASNGYFYVYYTPSTPTRARISRFTHSENSGGLSSTASVNSEVVLWQDNQDYASCCHYGGGIDIGPDGHIYMTTGDNFNGLNSQDLSVASGKVIRIATDGSIPSDNYGVTIDGVGGDVLDEIHSWGLRNPFRARFDDVTGRHFISEVGGNDQSTAWEDLHLGPAPGVNYGWPVCEGPCSNSDFPGCSCSLHDNPIWGYPHSGSGASITGGVVYRGTRYPSNPYRGAYFYGDFARRFIRYLTFSPTDNTVVTGDFAFEDQAGPVVAIEQGPDGAIYWLTISANGTGTGRLRRIVYVGDSVPVITLADANPKAGSPPLKVRFTGNATDDDGAVTYLWKLGNGKRRVRRNFNFTYSDPGIYNATLEVSDGTNVTVSDPIQITVGGSATIEITEPSETPQTLFRFGDTITFTATATDPEDGVLPASAFTWSCDFVRPSTRHPAFGPTSGTRSIDFTIPVQGQGFSGPVFYECTLTVTDSDGVISTASRSIYPDKVDLTFETVPAGLTLFFDGIPEEAPFVRDTLIQFEHRITAPDTQCHQGTLYDFSSWSDTGAAEHDITTPSANTTYSANYVDSGPCSTPTSMPVLDGLVMRLKGEQGVEITGNNISRWQDVSDTGNDVTVPTSLDGPTLISNELNGLDVVRFDGVDDGLGRTGLVSIPNRNANRSIFMVVKYQSDGWGGFSYGRTGCNGTFGLGVSGSSPTEGNLAIQGWCNAHDFPSATLGNGVGWITQSVIHNSGAFTHYANGQPITNVIKDLNTRGNNLRVGVEINNDTKVEMDVAEILVYDRALNESERMQVENYFQTTYFSSTNMNELPIAGNDSGFVASSAGNTQIDLLGNDNDPDGVLNPASVNIISPADHGSLSVPDPVTGSIIYTHDGSTAVSDRFTYTVNDGVGGTSNEATVFITIGTSLCSLPGSGLVLQLETNEGVGTTGSTVDVWLDQSGNGNDFSKVGDPQLIVGSLNGRDTIAFDGDDALEHIAGLAGLPDGAADRTVFTVLRYVMPQNSYAGFSYGEGSPNQAFALIVNGNEGRLTLQGWGANNDFVTSSNAVGAGWLTQSVVLNSNDYVHYRDGLQIGSGSHSFETTLTKATIASEIAGLGFSVMDAAAVLVYNRALSESERVAVENYLQERYFAAPCQTLNQLPTASDDSGDVDVPGGDVQVDILANDSDMDGVLNPATVNIVNEPSNGSLSNPDPLTGSITYTHDGSSTVTDSFTYTVDDEVGGVSNVATVSITITSSVACALPSTGLVLKLDAEEGVTLSGAIVEAWQDQSGNGNNFLKVGDPQLVVGSLNGRDIISFDGNDALEQISGLTGYPASTSDRSIFAVLRYVAPQGVYAGFSYGAGNSNQAFGLVVNGNRGRLTAQGWGAGNDFVTSSIARGTGWLTQSIVLSSNTLRHYRNGELIASNNHSFATNPLKATIASEIAGLGFSVLDAATVLIYDRALSDNERLDVENYLQERYFAIPCP